MVKKKVYGVKTVLRFLRIGYRSGMEMILVVGFHSIGVIL